MKHLSYIAIIILIFSCSQQNQTNTLNSKPNNNTTPLDTFVTQGNELVFIKPNEQELIQLQDSTDQDNSLAELDSDFNYYLNKTKTQIDSLGFKVSIPNQSVIKIIAFDQSISFLNKNELGDNNHYGIIRNYSDSEPVVELGVFTDTDILNFCK
tara:strand:- start:58 stop:519 length:462 start_codon:yes stop_codon:yes gene_type:complete